MLCNWLEKCFDWKILKINTVKFFGTSELLLFAVLEYDKKLSKVV